MALRELAERSVGGVVVRLLWNDTAPPGSDVSIEYYDGDRKTSFILYPPRDRALEAFHHPDEYACMVEDATHDLRAAI